MVIPRMRRYEATKRTDAPSGGGTKAPAVVSP
jgi:hypothetical protein